MTQKGKPADIPIHRTFASVAEFLAAVGPGLGFTTSELVQMFADSDDAGEAFILRSGTENYLLSSDAISTFFADHPKPQRPMSKEQENKFLKDRLKAMEAELLKLKGKTIRPEKPAPIEAKPVEEEDMEFNAEPLPLEEIPHLPVEMKTEDQVRQQLADELRAEQAKPRRGRPPKIA